MTELDLNELSPPSATRQLRPSSWQYESEFAHPLPGAVTKFHGVLTHVLIQELEDADISSLTYAQWSAAAGSKPVVVGKRLDDLVFDHHSLRASTLGLVSKVGQQDVLYPEGPLNLGIACAAVGEYGKSIDYIERAIALYSDLTNVACKRTRDPNADDRYREAHYQLGRVLVEWRKASQGGEEHIR